jgi:hypothetical protein
MFNKILGIDEHLKISEKDRSEIKENLQGINMQLKALAEKTINEKPIKSKAFE